MADAIDSALAIWYGAEFLWSEWDQQVIAVARWLPPPGAGGAGA